jgi:glycosyltransferase involved in cell wall biosynthesis
MVTTKDRAAELLVAVESALAQTVPVEVLVIDDGSTDGTAEAVAARFPQVRVVRHAESAGYIARRNEGAALASAPVVVSIDDDATFPSRRTVAQTLAEFDDRRVGAVAIPFVDVKYSPAVRQAAPSGPGVYLTAAYIGTAHALRRDVFLALGGYRPCLFHQGEERDYCVRMLEAGYVTRLGRADPIHHHESPRRDTLRMDLYGRRNDVLFGWHNVPMPEALVHTAGTALNGLRHGVRVRRPWNMVRGMAMGVRAVPATWGERRPVRREVYRLFRRLWKGGPTPLSAVAAKLPPPAYG